jgi:hypothetical protein
LRPPFKEQWLGQRERANTKRVFASPESHNAEVKHPENEAWAIYLPVLRITRAMSSV